MLAIVLMPDFRYGDVQTCCGAAALRLLSSSVFVPSTLDSFKISYVLLDVREVAAFFTGTPSSRGSSASAGACTTTIRSWKGEREPVFQDLH